jgi:hypothetical protein
LVKTGRTIRAAGCPCRRVHPGTQLTQAEDIDDPVAEFEAPAVQTVQDDELALA